MDCVGAPSPNFDERPKDTPIDILIMHYTGMETGAGAVARLCDPAARVSSHYTVDEDGTIFAHVPEECRAWHAGVSYWAGARDINGRSIGIEIVNPGHEFGYRSFPGAQIEAVIKLSREIVARHSIPPERVLGHSDVAPARKIDPGELFPWGGLALAGVGLWPQTRKHRLQGAVRGRAARVRLWFTPRHGCAGRDGDPGVSAPFPARKDRRHRGRGMQAHPGRAARRRLTPGR